MSTELATLEPTEIQLAFTSPRGIDILIERLREEAQSEVPDLSTAKGRARIASLAHRVSKTKVLVDDYGKELVAEEKKRLALIDADRKRWRDTCDAIRDEIRRPLTEWEAAEAARVQRHKDGIEKMRNLARLAMGAPSDEIRNLLATAEAIQLGEHWQEFAAEAGKAKDETISMLRVDLDRRLAHEAEQAELARLRAEAARREQEERERRIAEEAAERARREAEAKAQAEREAAERARIAAEQAEARAKAEAEAAERAERERAAAVEQERQRAERERIAAEQRAAAEQAAREADKEHRRTVNRAALAAIQSLGISEESARAIVIAIADGKIPHVSIRY